MSYWRIREAFKGEWLKTKREKLLVHGLILVAFVLYCLFLAQPIFDRLERTEGESRLYAISLPAVTDNIECSVNLINVNKSELVLNGWAFIRGQDMVNSQIFLVFKSRSDTYIFDTVPWSKPLYVLEHYKDLNLNLDDSGFFAISPLRNVNKGDYTLGIYIKKDNIEALQYTDNAVVKAGNSAIWTVRMSEAQEIPLPPESGGIRLEVDRCEVAEEGIVIAGWAFIEGQSAEDSEIYVVLKSETATRVFDTILQRRLDVTAAYVESGLNLDDSGFIARIPKEEIEDGVYKIGIYIRKGGMEALQYEALQYFE